MTRLWLSCVVVFVSSGCALAIELIAGRILAPYIGVSLYTWTSIIGIVLAGMSAGNFLGGLVADRYASRRLLGFTLIAGSIASLGILVVTDWVVDSTITLSLLPRIVFYTTADFFLPSLVLGMITPLVIKLALAGLEHSGRTVGTIYACSTLGSIFGTFLTGFWLISWIGTRAIVWVVAGVLLLMGIAIGDFVRSVKGAGALARAGVVFAFVLWLGSGYRAPCLVESSYYCIQVLETSADGHPARALMLDHLIHSYVVLDDPKALDYGYEHAYADLTRTAATGRAAIDTLFVGGGGYAFPRYVEAVYPTGMTDVVEIDPAVIAVAREQLGLPKTSRIRSFNQDARMFLADRANTATYDFIYGDAFNDLSVPYHLTTVEFDRLLLRHLKPNGVYLANIIDSLDSGEFLRAYTNALRAVFPHVYLFARGDSLQPFDRNTYVVMASLLPLDRARLDAVTSEEPSSARTTAMPEARLEGYLKLGRALTLTDDFAPVDQLLASLFIRRG
jgi:spermidine synthase